MAKFNIGKGINEYLGKLQNLEFSTNTIIGKAVYNAAEIVANQTKANIQALPVRESNSAGGKDLSPDEKTGLCEGFGIAKMQNDSGYFNVKLGMDGYNSYVTKRYPKGHPNSMIARSLERGTSHMHKNPVFSNAARAMKSQAEEAMRKTVDEEIDKIMK